MLNPKLRGIIYATAAAATLAGCGADDVTLPNEGVIVVPGPPTTPPPPPTIPGGSVTAAASCTPGTTDGGTVALQGQRGTVRNCVLPQTIRDDITLSGRRADGIMYSISGLTDVGVDVGGDGAAVGRDPAVLTVLPGVTVFAATRDTALVVNRGSRLVADGTAAQPIIFTALANLTGAGLTAATDNLWGGIIVNGRAPISDCDSSVSTSTVGGTAGCSRKAEGTPVDRLYGGGIATDNSGILRYVQINFTGVGANASEIQGLTTGGTGSGTVISHVQIHNSLDDGLESFGGTQNMDHLIMTGIADDSLDTDLGYRGTVQYVLAIRRANGTVGDTVGNQTMLEVDSSSGDVPNNAQPRQYLRLANFTFLQTTPNEPAMRIRGGADIALLNGIVVARNSGPNGCVDIDDAQTVQAAGSATDELGPPVLRSVVFDCNIVNNPDSDTFEADMFANPANTNVNVAFTNSLVAFGTGPGAFINGTAETAVPGVTNISAYGATLQQVSYIGAVSGASDTWYQGWTCNSDVANLNGFNNCTDIRVN